MLILTVMITIARMAILLMIVLGTVEVAVAIFKNDNSKDVNNHNKTETKMKTIIIAAAIITAIATVAYRAWYSDWLMIKKHHSA